MATILKSKITLIKDVDRDIQTNTTQLNVVQGKINTIISESAINELENEGTTLYDKYTTTEQTLDGITNTVGEHTSVLQDISLKDKDVQNGNPVMSTLSDDAVVHVGIDCTNLQVGESLTSIDIVVSDGNPDAPLPEDIEYGVLTNGLYKVNIPLSEPLQHGSKIFIDLDGLWKRQDNIGEPTIEMLPEEIQTKLNNIPSFSGETHIYTIANVIPNLHCIFKSSGWYNKYKTALLLDNKTDRGYVDNLINNTTTTTQTQIRQTQNSMSAELDRKISDLNGDITQSYSADIQATVDNFNMSFSNIQSIMENNNQNITNLNQYFDFSTDGMEIGKTGSLLKINIDNEEMQFKDGEAVVAYINGLKMYISNLDVVDSLEVGNHKIEKFNDEITIIRFIG